MSQIKKKQIQFKEHTELVLVPPVWKREVLIYPLNMLSFMFLENNKAKGRKHHW